MKKLIALLLVVVIAATALNIPAAASSVVTSGIHRGKEWRVNHSVTGGNIPDATTYFTYARDNIISISQLTYYHDDRYDNSNYTHREYDTTDDGCAFCLYVDTYPHVMDQSIATCTIVKGGLSKPFKARP